MPAVRGGKRQYKSRRYIMLCKTCKQLIPEKSIICPKCNKIPLFNDIDNIFEKNKYYPARWWKRLINYFLDLSIFYFLIFVISFIAAIFSIKLYKNIWWVDFLISLSIYSLYYISTELLMGRSIAKFITRTFVISSDGVKLDLNTIIIRTLCRFIPFEPFSLISSCPIGWHDSISHTLVVEKLNFEIHSSEINQN
jgi:uncharacterized RDD family membrane protein YckC